MKLEDVFADKREYRFRYPAGRKARRVLANRGLRPSPADEKALAAHRARSMKGMRKKA